MKAVWNGRVLAASDETIVVEGNHYFPPESIDRRCFEASDKRTYCNWKGEASYYDIHVDGERCAAAAWFYPEAMKAAKNIENYVAFWKGVEVTE